MAGQRLIINADDLGYSRKLTDAIVDCHRNGIITSTTLMVNMPAAEYAAERVRDFTQLGVGVHINLTEGHPVAAPKAVVDLLDDKGEFPGNAVQSKRLWRAPQLYGQVYTEIRAQVERCIDVGVTPTHCDSHHGIHKLPIVRRALVEVLRSYGILRARTPLSWHRLVAGASLSGYLVWLRHNLRRAPAIALHAWGHFQLRRAGIRTPDWKATRNMGVPSRREPKAELLACIAALPVGVSEILLHPGDYGPGETPSEWHLRTWAEDTPLCRDPEVAAFIRHKEIELISFRDL